MNGGFPAVPAQRDEMLQRRPDDRIAAPANAADPATPASEVPFSPRGRHRYFAPGRVPTK